MNTLASNIELETDSRLNLIKFDLKKSQKTSLYDLKVIFLKQFITQFFFIKKDAMSKNCKRTGYS